MALPPARITNTPVQLEPKRAPFVTTSTKPQPFAALFEINTPRTQLDNIQAAALEQQPEPEIRDATYTAVTTSRPTSEDPADRIVLLCVDCPYCEHRHVHPGGTVLHPKRGTRKARCVGRPARHLYYKLTGGEA